MLRRALLAAAVAVATPAVAAEIPPAPAAYVDISPVAAPVIVDGRLVNYVFVSVRLWARPGVDLARLREREPYFRDALVRAVHRTPFGLTGDPSRVNEAALTRAVAADAARIAGAAAFSRVQVTAQTSQRRIGPRPRR